MSHGQIFLTVQTHGSGAGNETVPSKVTWAVFVISCLSNNAEKGSPTNQLDLPGWKTKKHYAYG